MTRLALAVASVILLGVAPASAQLSMGPFSGYGTLHAGGAAGDDVGDAPPTLGLSLAVVEDQGWGAEFDFGYAFGDNGRNGRPDVQSYMMNVTGILPRGRLRPFVAGGLGVLHVRTCTLDCRDTESWTDWGFSAGAGAHFLFRDWIGLRGDVRYFATLQDHPDPGRLDLDFWRISAGVTMRLDVP